MNPYGSLWVLLDIFVFLWVPMGFTGPYVFVWILINRFASYWSLLVFMRHCGPYRSLCVLMGCNGSISVTMRYHGS